MKNTSYSQNVKGRVPDAKAETANHTVQAYEQNGNLIVTVGNKDSSGCRSPYGGKEIFTPPKKD